MFFQQKKHSQECKNVEELVRVIETQTMARSGLGQNAANDLRLTSRRKSWHKEFGFQSGMEP